MHCDPWMAFGCLHIHALLHVDIHETFAHVVRNSGIDRAITEIPYMTLTKENQ